MSFLFAIVVDGAAVELRPGQPFQTVQIVAATADDVAEFGGEIGQPVAGVATHGPTALSVYDDARLAHFCIQKVAVADAPDGQQLASYTLPVGEDGAVTYDAVWEAIPAPPVPPQVDALQLLEQIRRDGRDGAVATYVAGADADVQLWFNRATRVSRDNDKLIAGWHACGFTDAELDATFIAAALIAL